MNINRTLFILCVCFVATVAQANGQTRVKFDIPFDFQIQEELLPAGIYEVMDLSAHRGAILIRNVQSKESARRTTTNSVALGTRTNHDEVTRLGRLVFNRYGEDKYFLAEYRKPSSRAGLELIMSHTEKALVVSYSSPPRQISLLAKPSDQKAE